MPEFVKDRLQEPATSAVSDDPGWEAKQAAAAKAAEPPLSTTAADGVGEVVPEGTQGEATPPGETTEKSGAKDQTPPWVKAIISKSKNEANEARREAQLSRAELAKALEAITKMSPPHQSSAADEPVEPQENQFEDMAEYRHALVKYAKDLSRHSANKALAEFQEKQREAVVQAQRQRAKQELDSFLDRGRSKYEDFAEVCEGDDFTCSDAMLQAAQRSDVGEDVLYHLGQNRKEAKRIFQLDPVSQVREMTKIETKLIAEAEKKGNEAEQPRTTQKPTTSAPPPIKPLKSGNSASKDWEYYATKAPVEEYVQWVRAGRPLT